MSRHFTKMYEYYLVEYVEKLENLLFSRGVMKNPPCFKCGYNGPNYFQPDVHPCAARHHKHYRPDLDE